MPFNNRKLEFDIIRSSFRCLSAWAEAFEDELVWVAANTKQVDRLPTVSQRLVDGLQLKKIRGSWVSRLDKIKSFLNLYTFTGIPM